MIRRWQVGKKKGDIRKYELYVPNNSILISIYVYNVSAN